jgi:4-amino-4-deoxy-L-arabinose transferase-like glycosyltransferase
MVVLRVVSAALIYLLARRLGMRKGFAGLAVLLFGLSPLAVSFGRFVLLDNIAVPWLLGAFVLALSPRKHVGAAMASGLCMAVAVLTKETTLVLLPALLYTLWQNSDLRNRRYNLMVFSVVLGMICGFYLLYAVLKNELLEGSDHVSLVGAIKWQLLSRHGSGSILEAGTGAHGLAKVWFGLDLWLLGLSSLLLPVTFFVKRLRPIAVALLIQVVVMLRPGYLPYPYVIAMLPFAALVIAGTLNGLWGKFNVDIKAPEVKHLQRRAMALGLVITLVILVAPSWNTKLQSQMKQDDTSSARQAVVWIDKNVPRNVRLVAESNLWIDLVNKGFTDPQVVWTYKTETDPRIVKEIGGWEGMDYIVVAAPTLEGHNRKTFPTIFEAKDHATEVASFGEGDQKLVVLKTSQN